MSSNNFFGGNRMISRTLTFAAATLMLFVCGACGSKSAEKEASADSAGSKGEIKLYIQPAVTDSSLIGRWVNLVDVFDGKIFIQSDNLMSFDRDGRCLSSFNHVGAGPEEYAMWAGAVVDPKTCDWLVMGKNGRPILKRYSQNGDFLGTKEFISADNLQPLNDGWIATNSGFVDIDLTLYYLDSELNLVDSLATPFKHRMFPVEGGTTGLPDYVQSIGDQAFIMRNDTVYDITDPHRAPVAFAVVPHINNALPTKPGEPLDPDWGTKYIIPSYLFGKDYVLVWYVHNQKAAMSIYKYNNDSPIVELSNDYSVDTPGLGFDYEGNTLYGRPLLVKGNSFFFVVSDNQMIDVTGDENANPAIFELSL